jgi:hypothetical protein
MNHFKLTEFTHPADVFKQQEDMRANRIWGESKNEIPLPKYEKVERQPLSAGIYNLVRQMLP